ncbi:hypothetical protein E3N88_22744 [Mikania micrantha]|uniref:NB-ARC domain-containing protein n=1 Tax=Mikania micrantha TaxID=192012 RepID=A0A5N6NCQ9_9ASTR|nr:hypothetical protein E3N88_22744 [Mikania micrantha]
MLNSCVDEDLVGMRTRHQELELLLDVNSVGVRMVGIWGVGGGGKTTLATSLYMKISQDFQNHCIVENIREKTSKHGSTKLQKNMLSALFKDEEKISSVVEGKNRIKNMSSRRKVLLILDDVDKLDQLEALAGKHNWFGSGSIIIITTRDEHLLRTHKVDHIYPIRLLTDDEAVQVFKMHAYNVKNPIKDYETLALSVISYASGLPLALKVIGSFLCDKNKKEWISALDRLKEIPNVKVMDILKLSFDGLEDDQKELFLDIAYFFRFESVDDAMEIFEACGYYPEIGIKEMGHYIVRGEHPMNLRKHSRVWIDEEIEEMCFGDATIVKENYETEALRYYVLGMHENDISSRICEIMSSMKKLRWIEVIYFDKGEGLTCFSDSFQPLKLCFLKLEFGMQKKLWKGYKHLPHLKVLHLHGMYSLQSTPDFNGLPHLQKLTLDKYEEIPSGIGELSNLKELNLSGNDFSLLDFSISQLSCLKVLNLPFCNNLIELPDLPSSLVFLNARQTMSLTTNIVNDDERLLQSMLEGEAIENGSMILLLRGLKIPMGFTPPLLRRKRYTLQLPENWRDDFSGFLMCAVPNNSIIFIFDFKIIVKQASSGVSFEDDVVWEESDGDMNTLVWYLSFDLLRDTAWWNQTYKALSFEITKGECSGFGIRLVAKKNRSGLMETSTTNSYDYTLFKIEYDKASDAIMISSLVNYY